MSGPSPTWGKVGPLVLGCMEELDTLVLVATLEVPALQMTKLALRYLHESGFPRTKSEWC
jgi:hypothetical protein